MEPTTGFGSAPIKPDSPKAPGSSRGGMPAAGMDVLDALQNPIVQVDPDGIVTAVNAAWRRFAASAFAEGESQGVGLAYRDVARRTCLQAEVDWQRLDLGLQQVLDGERDEFSHELPCSHKPSRWIRLTITALPREPRSGAVVVLTDISESRQAAEQARRLRDIHAASSRIHGLIARGGDLQGIFENACRIAVEQGGLRMAWVGLASADGFIRPTALWGHDEGYVDLLQISGDPDRPGGRGPAGQAFRTGAPACCNNLEADDGSVQTRAEALQRGYRSCAAFALAPAGRITGVLAVYSGEPHFFGAEEIELLGLLTESLSHAMHSHELDQQRRRSEQALRASEASLAAAQQVGKVGSWETDITTLAVS